MLKGKKTMVLCLTETWTHGNKKDEELKLDGYTLRIRRDKMNKDGRGGGILVYALDTLTAEEDSEFTPGEFSEATCLKVKTHGSFIRIITVYRSPNSDVANNNALEPKIVNSSRSAMRADGQSWLP